MGLSWLITGGESGPGARTYDLAWARSIVDQCRRATADGYPVAAFVKQFGARAQDIDHDREPMDLTSLGLGLGRKGDSPALLARHGLLVREFPEVGR